MYTLMTVYHQLQQRDDVLDDEDQHSPVASTATTRHQDTSAGPRVPLSKSSVRAADTVNTEILDRAINDDVHLLTSFTKCSWSLCQLAGLIVSRVLDSARSRVSIGPVMADFHRHVSVLPFPYRRCPLQKHV